MLVRSAPLDGGAISTEQLGGDHRRRAGVPARRGTPRRAGPALPLRRRRPVVRRVSRRAGAGQGAVRPAARSAPSAWPVRCAGPSRGVSGAARSSSAGRSSRASGRAAVRARPTWPGTAPTPRRSPPDPHPPTDPPPDRRPAPMLDHTMTTARRSRPRPGADDRPACRCCCTKPCREADSTGPSSAGPGGIPTRGRGSAGPGRTLGRTPHPRLRPQGPHGPTRAVSARGSRLRAGGDPATGIATGRSPTMGGARRPAGMGVAVAPWARRRMRCRSTDGAPDPTGAPSVADERAAERTGESLVL